MHLKLCFECMILLLYFSKVSSKGAELTIEIQSGQTECFFESIKGDTSFEVEYQVIEGGDYLVNFGIEDPSGAIIIQDVRRQDNIHKIEKTIAGDYKFCFDHVGGFGSKIVYFELDTSEPEVDQVDWDKFDGPEDTDHDVTIENFRTSLDKVKLALQRTVQTQQILRVFEARDRMTQENNFERVNFWSVVHLLILVGTGLLQVYMIRSLFYQKRPSSMQART